MLYILIIIVMLLVYSIYTSISKWKPVKTNKIFNNKFFIYGHRGVPSIAPENTIYSFLQAFDLNVNGIELDIQITKDDILAVHHDNDLKRLTGKPTLISKLNYEELNKIDARGNEFNNLPPQKIPKLDDVLDILPKDQIINIEIKSNQVFSEGMEGLVVESILKYSLIDRAIVSSFNPIVLYKIKKINPQIITAHLWGNHKIFSSILWIYFSKPDIVHGNISLLNEKNIAFLKSINLKVFAYTVNTKEDFKKAISLKLDGIFTDNPKLFK